MKIRATSWKLHQHVLRRPLLLLFMLACMLFLAIQVGSRPIHVGTDTATYLYFYDGVVACGCNPARFEPLFYSLARISQLLGREFEFFFTLVSLVQSVIAVLLAKVLSDVLDYQPRQRYSLVLIYLALLLISPFFFAIQTNILRQGCAALAVALAFLFAAREKWRASISWFVVSCLFHYSSFLYLPFLFLFRIRFRLLLYIWLGLLVAYALGLTRWFVSILPHVAGFSLYDTVAFYGEKANYTSGIRYDFLGLTVAPVIMLALVNLVVPSAVSKERARKVIPIYLALTFPFLIFGWAAFADRYAYGAWVFMPALLSVMSLRFTGRYSRLIGLTAFVFGVVYFNWMLSHAY